MISQHRLAKEPLLLIPGMMCDARLWQYQIDALAAQTDIHVAEIHAQTSIPALAETLLQELTWETFSVAGLSMGGIVAMELLKQAAPRINRCALMDTNHSAETAFRQKLRADEIAQANKEGGLRHLILEKMRPAYLAPKRKYDQVFLDLVLDMAMQLGPQAFINQSIALRDRPDYSDVLTHTRCPVLILCGEWDMLCPPTKHEQMARLLPKQTQNELVIIKQSGHLTTLEAPTQTTHALQKWLK